MGELVVGLVLFFGVHGLPMRPDLRKKIAGKIGLVLYQALFALLSLLSLYLIVSGYGVADHITLWEPPAWTRHITFALMLPVFPLLIMAYLPGRLRKVVPHPMLMAIKIWAFAHLVTNGDLASVLLFGAFLAYGVIDLISIKRRQRAQGIEPKVGPVRNDIIAIIVGLGLYAGMVYWGHAALINIPLIA